MTEPVDFESLGLENNVSFSELFMSERNTLDINTLFALPQHKNSDPELDRSLERFNLQSPSIEFDPTADGVSDSNTGSSISSDLKLKIGLKMLPIQQQQCAQKKGERFNLMVAGKAGLGKTTFINTLFNSSLMPIQKPSTSNFLDISDFRLVEDGFPLRLSIVETTNFGRSIQNEEAWLPLSRFVDSKYRMIMSEAHQPHRSSSSDQRIHACVYFLPSTLSSITPLDLETMKALCTRVNLVPVIGKADSMTREELQRYKSELKELFESHAIKFCDFLGDEEVIQQINSYLPFSFIGATDLISNGPDALVRGRKYDWGSFETENEEHCDFLALRNILIRDYMLEFILSTDSHYQRFREEFLLNVMSLKLDGTSLTTSDGITQLLAYHSFKYCDLENFAKDHSNLLEYKEKVLKSKINVDIEKQENRFRSWKRALVDKQTELNKEVEEMHHYLTTLQQDIQTLEDNSELGQDQSETNSLPYIELEVPGTLKRSHILGQFSFHNS